MDMTFSYERYAVYTELVAQMLTQICKFQVH
jgi:hypothetical protein